MTQFHITVIRITFMVLRTARVFVAHEAIQLSKIQKLPAAGKQPGFGMEVPLAPAVAIRPQFDLMIGPPRGHADGPPVQSERGVSLVWWVACGLPAHQKLIRKD